MNERRPGYPYNTPEEGSWQDTHLHQIAKMAMRSLTLTPTDVAALYPEIPYPGIALLALKNTALPGRLMQLAEEGYLPIAKAICKRAEEKAWEQFGVYPYRDAAGDEEC